MFEHIKNLIELGHRVAVKGKDGLWKVFLFVNGGGNLEGTAPMETIEESLARGINSFCCNKEELEKYYTTEYKIITEPHKMLPIGTKVEILENVRDIAKKKSWIETSMNMIGESGFEIKNTYNGDRYEIWNYDKTDYSIFPHWAVAPVYEEESKISLSDDELIAELEKRGKIISGKIVK